MSSFGKVELYGGAISTDLPANFADVSQIRQVPDNQEVYLDRDGFTSIVFDILERVDVDVGAGAGAQNPDLDALKYHFQDIVDDDTSTATQIWTTNSAVFTKLPPHTPAYTLFATQRSAPESVARAKAPDFVGILMTMLRLPAQETDIIISINVPHAPGEYEPSEVDPSAGKNGRLLETAMRYRERILQTFEIKDWGLFVQE